MNLRKWIFLGLLGALLLLGGLFRAGSANAAMTPVRQVKLLVPFTQYEWWMILWSDNSIACQIFIEHEGLPTTTEAAQFCGTELVRLWESTGSCKPNKVCNGVYLHLVATQPAEKEVLVELPVPEMAIDLDGCTPIPPENRCAAIPNLRLSASEPLPNEAITSIQGLYNGAPFECQGAECLVPLRPTPILGTTVEFWANSSYGDSSQHFTAQVRVLDTGVAASPVNSGWYVDVISEQWQGAPIASCARIWEAFPPAGGAGDWLATPEQSALIASDEPYFYLAGRLISQGQVNAADCPSGGLLPNGYANTCGIEKARLWLIEWQNQFDEKIVETARITGVPAQLMKNLFAQESQFWPGVFRVPYELGLGQLTDKGTDSIFLWNPGFFADFCPLVLSADTCSGGYLSLPSAEKALLRGALAAQAGVDCPTCPAGIDLDKAKNSIDLFAQTLLANCAQVDRTIYTATKLRSGLLANYQDLWRFTIANYHAGPGCLSYAIHAAWQGTTLTWEQVSANFTPACQGVVPYVNEIAPSE